MRIEQGGSDALERNKYCGKKTEMESFQAYSVVVAWDM